MCIFVKMYIKLYFFIFYSNLRPTFTSQYVADTDHKGALFCVDRGYRTPSISAVLQRGRCSVLGTIQRQATFELFPYTFDHPEAAHNVPSSGVHVSLYSRGGKEKRNEVAFCYRVKSKPVKRRALDSSDTCAFSVNIDEGQHSM